MNIGSRPLLENWERHALATEGVQPSQLRAALLAEGCSIEPCQFCQRDSIVRPDLETFARAADPDIVFACSHCVAQQLTLTTD